MRLLLNNIAHSFAESATLEFKRAVVFYAGLLDQQNSSQQANKNSKFVYWRVI
jgi:hypothetical protein